MSDELLVEIRRYGTRFEAELAADRLRQLGYRAAAFGLGRDSLASPYSMLDGVRLVVHRDDAAEAAQALTDIESEL